MVSFSLRHFHPSLCNCNVLIRMDNTSVVAYINCQGITRSMRLPRLSIGIIQCSREHLMSLHVTRVPGIVNVGADLLSRENPLQREVVKQIWERYCQASVDLFSSQENEHCLLFFTLAGHGALGVDALAHPWPRVKKSEEGSSLILVDPRWPDKLWIM